MSKRNIPVPKPSSSKKQTFSKPYTWESGYWTKYWQQIAIIFALGVGLYIYTVKFDYVLDDQIVITKNDFTKQGIAGIGKIMSTESMQGYFGEQKNLVVGARYRPLSIVTFAIEHQMWGLNPFMSHLMNVLLYALSGILLYRILLLLFPLKSDDNAFLNIPFIASLLFIAHPIHSEVVANVKGRDEIMTLMGALGSLYFTFKYLAKRDNLSLILSGVMFFLGLLSKENAITFLAVIPLAVFIAHKAEASDYTKVMIPLVVATVVYLMIRYSVIGYFLSNGEKITDLMNNPFVEMNVGQKLATIFYTLIVYLKLQLFPHPLTHDYYPYAIPKVGWTNIWSILSLLIHVGLGVFALRNIKSKSIPAFAILFYLFTISIVSNIVFPVGTFMNERFVYISSIGFCVAAAWALLTYVMPKSKPLAIALLSIAALALSAKTIARVPAWKDKLSLNTAAIKTSHNSARANCFMATALFEQFQKEKDPVKQKALLTDINKYIKKSLEIYPDYFSAMQMYSGVLGSNYALDRNLDNLLAGFKQILSRRTTITYIDQYLEYLDKTPGVDQTKMRDFYYDLAWNVFYKEKQYYNNAAKFMQKAIMSVDDTDPKSNYAMFKIMTDAGQGAEGEKFRAVALTIDPNIASSFK